jgi:hypothetical protein
MLMWDFLEEGTAILDQAAEASQFLEGDLYPTSSLVVPMTYKLMATSSDRQDVKFRNRDRDAFNDDTRNPVKVPHADLSEKIQTAREGLHEQLVDRFDTNVPRDVKMFWFIAAICDPRFKKLTFNHDRMLTDRMRDRAFRWFSAEFNQNYKGKVKVPGAAPAAAQQQEEARHAPPERHLKRRKTSAASFFADSDDEDEREDEGVVRAAEEKDELAEYLALPQIKYKAETDSTDWWKDKAADFPNVAVMARQYLGCPATSASVERLFSQVGIAFSDKRKSASAATLENIMFTRGNLP